jgi:hypothetical protein
MMKMMNVSREIALRFKMGLLMSTGRYTARAGVMIVAEAVRHYVAQMDGAAPLGQSRHAQLLRDLGLTAEERVRDAEQRDLLAVAPSLANAIEQPLRFATYAEFAEWRGRQESK